METTELCLYEETVVRWVPFDERVSKMARYLCELSRYDVAELLLDVFVEDT